jgi:flagellin
MPSETDFILRSLGKNQSGLLKINQALASGKRINNAADDAAGLSIAKQLATNVVLSDQGRRNIADANSLLEIADSALNEVSNIGTRLAELAQQSANGTLSDSQRSALNAEFQELAQEAQRITATTSFNGVNVLKSNTITIQAGIDGGSNSQLNTSGTNADVLTQGLSGLSVTTQTQARTALDQLGSFISNVASSRGQIGGVVSRFNAASNNLASRSENEAAAQSRIEDIDVAEASAKRASLLIQQQTGPALLASANRLSKDTVLSLLS